MLSNSETDSFSTKEELKYDEIVRDSALKQLSKQEESEKQIPDDLKVDVLLTMAEIQENREPELEECLILFEKFVAAWKGHRVMQAHKDLLVFEEKMNQSMNVLSPSSQKFLNEFLEENKIMIQDCRNDYAYAKTALDLFDDHEGWTTESIGKSVVSKYKQIPRTALISLRFEARLDIPLMNILTLLYEIDLYDQWIPFLTQSENVKNVHRASKLVYLRLALPSPLSDRDAFLYGYGVDFSVEDGSILILARSIDSDPDLVKRHGIDLSKTAKNVKMGMSYAVFKIKPLGPSTCEFLGIANVDPKITFLPSRLLNFLVRKATSMLIERMVGKAKDIRGSPWEKAMQNPEKKDFYDWLTAKVEEVVSKLG